MLKPHAATLRALLARYADARIAHHRQPTDLTARAVEDVVYTLCVTTATRTIEEAVEAADAVLAAAQSTTPQAVPAPRGTTDEAPELAA
ncbi:DUF5133 domain-containing protein [Streptomyces sp. NPDC060194]|uniref:DUF5133 domain-containing protein n=1 Tax=Streptomyces sp. NPDC060194 TaxID=3347069 RepID=UPI0036597A7F